MTPDSLAREYPPLKTVVDSYIDEVITAVDGNMSRAARLLGMDRRTLYRNRRKAVKNVVPL